MNLSPLPMQRFTDGNGNPLYLGTLATFAAGTTTPIATYQDSIGTPNTNPITLNPRGECSIWLDQTLTYKFTLKDQFGNLIWTVDNVAAGITFASLTQQIIGQILWPRSQAEINASVNPVNLGFRWGSFQRYGADPLGIADSATAFANAIASNDWIFDEYPGGGSYKILSTVIGKSELRISGQVKGATSITLSSSTVSAAAFQWTAFTQDVHIEHLKIFTITAGKTQSALRFSELRTARIENCWFQGPDSASNDTFAILLDGSGTFSGDVTITKNYIQGHKYGMYLNNTANPAGGCTTVRIVENEMYGRPGAVVAGSHGVTLSNTAAGPLIEGNTFQGWERGVYSEGTFFTQVGNYYEGNTNNWEWVRGAGNARIWGCAAGEKQVSGGAPIFPQNNVDNCVVLGVGTNYWDNASVSSGLGYLERGRSVALGEWTTPTFAAGNFTGNGAMTWTVIAGNVTTLRYSLVGKMMSVIFQITGTTVGGTLNTQLRIAIPGGFTAASAVVTPGAVVTNGTTVTGALAVTAGGSNILIGKDLLLGTNFAAGATDVYGEIDFEVQ